MTAGKGQSLVWFRQNFLRLMPLFAILVALFVVMTESDRKTLEMDRHSEFWRAGEETILPQPPITDLRPDQSVMYYGIHVEKIYEVSLHSRTFSADGYLWIEWSRDIQSHMEAYDLAPEDLIRLVNRIESWDSLFEVVTDQPIELSAGRFHQKFRFSSRFYDDEINFERDPFDQLILPVIVEIAPDSMSQKYRQVLLYPHHGQNGFLGSSGGLSGYQLEGARLTSQLHRYPSRFGSWYEPVFSQARLDIVYHADYWSAFVTWMLPLLIVMSVVLLSPAVAGSLGDVRLAIPSTALLTLVFMHQAYRDDLPSLPYLTFLDQLFACSYLIALGLVMLFTWGTNVYAKAPADQKEAVMVRIDRADLVFQICSIAAFSLVALLTWWGSA